MVKLGSTDLGIAVNTAAQRLAPSILFMDEREIFATWGDVAARVRDAKKGTTSALAAYLAMDPSQLSRSLSRGSGDLTVNQSLKIAAFFDGVPAEPGVAEAAVDWAGRSLPAFGYVSTVADPDRFRLAQGAELDAYPLPPGLTLHPSEYFVVIQPSSSMEPRLYAGEAVVVRRNMPPARDKLAVIEFNDGTAVIKSYRARRAGRIFAEQLSPEGQVDYESTSVKAIHAVYLRL